MNRFTFSLLVAFMVACGADPVITEDGASNELKEESPPSDKKDATAQDLLEECLTQPAPGDCAKPHLLTLLTASSLRLTWSFPEIGVYESVPAIRFVTKWLDSEDTEKRISFRSTGNPDGSASFAFSLVGVQFFSEFETQTVTRSFSFSLRGNTIVEADVPVVTDVVSTPSTQD
jgi:hypothetical protein